MWGLMVIQWLHVLLGIFWFGSTLYLDFAVIPAVRTLPLEQQRTVSKPVTTICERGIIPAAILVMLLGLMRFGVKERGKRWRPEGTMSRRTSTRHVISSRPVHNARLSARREVIPLQEQTPAPTVISYQKSLNHLKERSTMKNRRLSFKPAFVLAALLLALVSVSSTAAAFSTGTTYSIAQATATPQGQCTDVGCITLLGYVYTGGGTCQTGCVGFPSGPIDATLTFSLLRTFPPSPCRMQRGTGLLAVTWPGDPSLPSAQGTFTFKARDAKTVDFEGSITSSTLSVVLPGEPVNGFVTFPPSPCVGGTATAAFTFG